MRKRVTTRLGTFILNRHDCIGFSVYEANRPLRIQRQEVKPKELFCIQHRDMKVLRRPPRPRMYSGTFIARFTIDGIEI